MTSGISHATGGGTARGGGNLPSYYGDDCASSTCDDYEPALAGTPGVAISSNAPPSLTPKRPRASTAKLSAYGGVQAVYESTGSLTAELGVVDRRFRIDGAITHYVESMPMEHALSMTMWSFTAGVRIDDGGPSRAYLEGGVMGLVTKGEPDGDSSLTGGLVGARLEHPIARRLTLVGIAQAAFFEDHIRAWGGRVGVRYGHFEGGVRVLDFNVGPALFGPELGLRF